MSLVTSVTLRDGYGQFWSQGRLVRAHRWAYQRANGALPTSASVLHSCDNPACVKAEHLFLGSQTDNMRDAAAKGRLSTEARREANRKKALGRSGVRNANARLTEAQIADIRARRARGESLRQIAAAFGVHNSTIGRHTEALDRLEALK